VAIIPLGHGSRRDSSSLPEGCSQLRLAFLRRQGPQSRKFLKLSREKLDEPGRLSPPIWPCTTRGFPCLPCCHGSGELLPHRFTLAELTLMQDVLQVFLKPVAEAAIQAVYFLWHFP